MIFSNPRYVNAAGGIRVSVDGAPDLYMDGDHPDYAAVAGGSLGAVVPFDAAAAVLEDKVSAKALEIEQDFMSGIAQLRLAYLSEERESWDMQVEQARAWLADNGAVTPLLDNMLVELSSIGVDKSTLVASILDKRSEYEDAYGSRLGEYQRRRKQLAAIDLAASDAGSLVDAV